MEPVNRTRTRKLPGRSKVAPSASQNLVRAKRRLDLLGFTSISEPAHVFGSGPARLPPRVTGSLSLGALGTGHDAGAPEVLGLPFELTPEDAIAFGAALIASARDALGAALPSPVAGDDGEGVLALAEALEALKGLRT